MTLDPNDVRTEPAPPGISIYMDGKQRPPFYGVRAIHVPTGIEVTVGTHKSQLYNRIEAMEELERRVNESTP